jgi:hypothetical protein
MRAIRPAHLILLDCPSQENKLRSSSLCNFLHAPSGSPPPPRGVGAIRLVPALCAQHVQSSGLSVCLSVCLSPCIMLASSAVQPVGRNRIAVRFCFCILEIGTWPLARRPRQPSRSVYLTTLYQLYYELQSTVMVSVEWHVTWVGSGRSLFQSICMEGLRKPRNT